MQILRLSIVPACVAILSACAHTGSDAGTGLGLQWVKHSAEYQAISAQVYAQATRDLERFVADTSWTALPGERIIPGLPPAVILDVDETVVSNIDFQLTFERPFANHKLDTWSSSYESIPIRGVVEFVSAARAAGVTVFFVTNRPCQPKAGSNDHCPQEKTTINDIRELGIDVEPEFVLLSGEQRGWDREKLTRREIIAITHRVIMLIGDDFSDFVACVRETAVPPCSRAGSRQNRLADVEKYREYWGNGWYILPNPMHGSWTSVD